MFQLARMKITKFALIDHAVSRSALTLRSDCQGLTLTPLLTLTVDTMYCNVVLIVSMKASQCVLCNTDISDVQKSSIWGIGTIGGNVDDIEISAVSTT